MTDLSAKSGQLLCREGAPHTCVVSVLCWFSRQLVSTFRSSIFLFLFVHWIDISIDQTNMQTVKILQGHNVGLQKTMMAILKHIFEHDFLPSLPESFLGMLRADTSLQIQGPARSIRIEVLPLPRGSYQKDCSAGNFLNPDEWRPVHDEVFGKLKRRLDGSTDFIIDPSRWYSYLVSQLLNALVRFLYGQIHPEFSTRYDRYDETIPYIIQCLAYAQPTLENLDTLRAMVYLYPQVTPAWNPPEGFWILVVEFLQVSSYPAMTIFDVNLRWWVHTRNMIVPCYLPKNWTCLCHGWTVQIMEISRDM